MIAADELSAYVVVSLLFSWKQSLLSVGSWKQSIIVALLSLNGWVWWSAIKVRWWPWQVGVEGRRQQAATGEASWSRGGRRSREFADCCSSGGWQRRRSVAKQRWIWSHCSWYRSAVSSYFVLMLLYCTVPYVPSVMNFSEILKIFFCSVNHAWWWWWWQMMTLMIMLIIIIIVIIINIIF